MNLLDNLRKQMVSDPMYSTFIMLGHVRAVLDSSFTRTDSETIQMIKDSFRVHDEFKYDYEEDQYFERKANYAKR